MSENTQISTVPLRHSFPVFIRNGVTFILLVFILFSVPVSMLNVHPALKMLATEIPAGDGIIQLAAQIDENGDVRITSAQTLADISLLIPSNVVFSPIFAKKRPTTLWLRGFHFINQPLPEFQLSRHTQLENLFGASTILVHLSNEHSMNLWQQIIDNPQFESQGCTSPSWLTFAQWDICIAQFNPALIQTNITGVFGWSPTEPWGAWTIDTGPRALFIADTESEYQLEVEWFPYCIEGKQQSADVFVNQVQIGEFTWDSCDTQIAVFDIPRSALDKSQLDKQVLNRRFLQQHELKFEFAYATNNSSDPRQLAVGFNKVLVTKK